MLRHEVEGQHSNGSIKRIPDAVTRPRSGCSEMSFNLDTPLTPHFNQVTTSSSTSSGHQLNEVNGETSLTSSPKSFTERSHFNFVIEQDIFVFVKTPTKSLWCPVCSNVFIEPVITTCGHTFCGACVKRNTKLICPIDNKSTTYVVDNIAVSEQIGELLIHCKFGCKKTEHGYVVDENGCPENIKISERYEHESKCDYLPMNCPNNPYCAPVFKKDLEHHLATCNSIMCPNYKNGCKFIDTKSGIEEHLMNCSFGKVLVSMKDKNGGLDDIRQENKSAREDIDFLFTSLQGLNQRFEQMELEKDELISHVDRMSRALEDAHKELADARRDRQMLMEDFNRLKQYLQTPIHQHSVMDPETIIKCKGTCVGHNGPVWCLAVNNDFLFSGSSDNFVKVWDTSCNYKCVKTLSDHTGIVLALTVYGSRLYSGSQDTKILVWNIDKDFELEETLEAHDNPVCTLAASRAMVFSGSLKIVKVWSADSGKHKVKKEITGFNHWVRALYATDKELYCGSYQTIEIYSLDTLEVTTTLKTYGGSVYSICVTDKHVLCGTYENMIHVWELATMEQVTTLQGHNGTVYALTWMSSPSGILMFSASYDRTIRNIVAFLLGQVWSQTYMICKQTLIRHAGSVACLAVSKGRLFSGGIDSLVKVWQ